MEFNKKLSKSGSVTLPSALRRDLGLADNEKFRIQVAASGDIILHRTQGQCLFCESDEFQLITFSKRLVCIKCVTFMEKIRADEVKSQ